MVANDGVEPLLGGRITLVEANLSDGKWQCWPNLAHLIACVQRGKLPTFVVLEILFLVPKIMDFQAKVQK